MSAAGRSLLAVTLRAALGTLVLVVILGPLLSLVVWSLAERWHWPAPFPQQLGLKYWLRMLQGDPLRALTRGVTIATITTVLALVAALPVSYLAARRRLPA
ncbi:MAG: ABC transporter permease, partial [Armatimonadota bacterium]|nr:ABC transporter permease [Armatimonadota bacterium]